MNEKRGKEQQFRHLLRGGCVAGGNRAAEDAAVAERERRCGRLCRCRRSRMLALDFDDFLLRFLLDLDDLVLVRRLGDLPRARGGGYERALHLNKTCGAELRGLVGALRNRLRDGAVGGNRLAPYPESVHE